MKTSIFAKLTVCFAASLLMSSFYLVPKANAHAHHSADACSSQQPSVCAHLGYDSEPNTSDEWQFMLHFQSPTLDTARLANVEVKLWMEMGHHSHGSSPVTITPKDASHFLVEEAYFPMQGTWQIKVRYTYDGQAGELVIPVLVK